MRDTDVIRVALKTLESNMENWGFADHNGDLIMEGWQGTAELAAVKAQELADDMGNAVSYWARPQDEPAVAWPRKAAHDH